MSVRLTVGTPIYGRGNGPVCDQAVGYSEAKGGPRTKNLVYWCQIVSPNAPGISRKGHGDRFSDGGDRGSAVFWL